MKEALIIIVIALPVAALAVVGARHLVRGTPIRRVRAPSRGDALPAIRDEDFVAKAELMTRAELHGGHGIRLLECGDETYPALWEDLASARRSITVQMYYALPGEVADRFLELLSERARAGVKVHFLRDAFGAKDLKKEYIDDLRAAGVEVASFRPVGWLSLDKAYARSHIRVVVVDAKVGYTGGFGMDDKWLGDGRTPGQWRDTNVRFTGPAVAQLQATFAAGWAEATGHLLTGDDYFDLPGISAAPEDEPQRASLIHTAPTIGSTAAERLLVLTICGARERLWITNAYFVPDDDFLELLCSAARNGVDVRILTASDVSDVRTVLWAGRAGYEQLMEAGVRVFEYLPSMHHAKCFVADGVWCGVGTMNFDNRSLAFNDETMLLAYDRKLGGELERSFERDLVHSEEIDLEQFRRRSPVLKLRERGARLARRIL